MGKNPSIKKNMLMNTILTSANFIFPLITYSYVARVLLPSGTGKVAFVQSVLAYFTYISSLGIPGYGLRECAKIRHDKQALSKFVQELLAINLVSTIVAYAALAGSLFFVHKFQDYMALFIIMSSGMLLQMLGVEWLYQALEQYTYITVRSLVFKCISVVLTFLLIHDSDDYIIYGILVIFTSSASSIFNFIHIRKYIELKKFKDYCFVRHLKPIMIFFASSIIITIYGHFDSTMLGFMKGDAEVGLYSSAMKVRSVVLSLSTGVVSVLVPRLSLYAGEDDQQKYLNLLLKSLQVSCILFLPLTIIIIFNASGVLAFVCGEEYASATHTLIVLMVCSIVLCMTNLFGNQMLIPKGMEKFFSRSVFIGMFINLGLNTLLIPRFGAVGAAVATLVTESFNMIYMGCHTKREIIFLKNNIKIHRYLIALGVAVLGEAIILLIMHSAHIVLFLRLSINTALFFILYWGMLLCMKEPVIFPIFKKFIKRLNLAR